MILFELFCKIWNDLLFLSMGVCLTFCFFSAIIFNNSILNIIC